MSDTKQMSTAEVEQQRDAFIDKFLGFAAGTFSLFSIYIGERLGYYRALANGALTSAELASQTKTHERYTREWLEQQTVAGILEVEDETLDFTKRRFRLPPGHAEPLIETDSLNYIAPLTRLMAGAVRPLDSLLEAYRTGSGVPYSEYGADLHEGQAAINRPAFLKQLAQEWIPAMKDVHERLQSDPPARVADIGCGHGWSSIGISQVYAKARVDGFDLDDASILFAKENAKKHKVDDRVHFQVRDAGDPALAGQYDLVTALECVHDMSNPVAALKMMRQLAGENGTVLIVDERVGDTFTSKGNDVEWMMYGWSILHCLPVGMVDAPSAGTGTVMRTDTLKSYAKDAGFSKVEILPIENFFFRFYRLTP